MWRVSCEHDLAETARDILHHAKTTGCTIILPSDVVIARELKQVLRMRWSPRGRAKGMQ